MSESEIYLQSSLAELIEKSQKKSNEINATVFVESPIEKIDVRISPTKDDDTSGIVLAAHVPASKSSKTWLASVLNILVSNAVEAMEHTSEFNTIKVSEVIERDSPNIILHISDIRSTKAQQSTFIGSDTRNLRFEGTLTADFLQLELSPILKAIADFQESIDKARKKETSETLQSVS